MSRPLRTLKYFSGAGGASEGLLSAGCELLACVEYDPHAHATALAAGHPSVLGDVRDVTAQWSGDPVDLLWASPPCQAFSSAGKRKGEADTRNGWPWTLDAVDTIHPRWLICENVPGLLHHNGGCKPRDGSTPGCAGCYWIGSVLPAFRARFPHVEVRTLDAADHGVPQHRRRVFLVAGPRAIQWPEPTHGPGRAYPWVSIGEALGVSAVGRPTAHGPGEVVAERGLVDLSARPARTVSGIAAGVEKGGGMGFFVRTECLGSPASPSTEPAPTVSTVMNTYLHAEDPGTRRAKDVLTCPAPCLTIGDHASSRNVISASAKARGEYDRAGISRLTVRQCATLQGFPADYPWQGTQTEQYRQVGNAVIPRIAELLARAVTDADGAP